MKKLLLNITLVATALFGTMNASAQEEAKSPCQTQCHVGLEIATSDMWRGLQETAGPALLPSFSITAGGFTIGAEGSLAMTDASNFGADLFMKYAFPFGLSLELFDYYEGGNWMGMNFEDIGSTHAIEPAIRYQYGKLQFFAALMCQKHKTFDFYGEISYDFDIFKMAIGGGNGEYTMTQPGKRGDFAICNLSLSKETSIQVTDKFALPIKAGAMLNPAVERFYVFASIYFGK